MKLYIPSLGNKLKLIEPWSFDLYAERRNDTLWEKLGLPTNAKNHFLSPDPITPEEIIRFNLVATQTGYRQSYKTRTTLPVNSILTVDRIYIKKGGEEFNSVTFNLNTLSAGLTKGKCRFWAKLHDVNTMEFEIVNS